MYPDDYGPTKDLTPGDFHMMEGTVDVKTDSLYAFSQSYFKDVLAFEMNSAMPMTFMTMDANSEYGSYSIGKDEQLTEARGLGLRMSLASDQAKTLVTDLVYGNKALVNVAMVMSEQYNGTDGWNGARTADAVNDAFNPPASGESLADVRSKADAERERTENLPVVDPSDVKFYNMSGLVAGKDYIIAGSEGASPTMYPGANVTPDNPATKNKDESKEQNPYFTIPAVDLEQPDPYVPPGPQDPNDSNALRFNDDGSPAPTLEQLADDAEEEPGVISAYVEDGNIVRVHEPSSGGSYGGSSTYTTTSPNPYS